MDAPATLVWVAPAPPDADQTRALSSWALAHGVRLMAPNDEAVPALAIDPRIADDVERLLDRARDAMVARDGEAVDRVLSAAASTLRAHPELPQAAWLMAEVERARSSRLRRIAPVDEAAASAAWTRAEALDGGRVAGIGEQAAAPPPAATLTLPAGLPASATVLLDGSPAATTTVSTRAGPHALVVLVDGSPAWASWIDAPAGTSSVQVSAPLVPGCSKIDVARAKMVGEGIDASGVRCGSVARRHGRRRGRPRRGLLRRPLRAPPRLACSAAVDVRPSRRAVAPRWLARLGHLGARRRRGRARHRRGRAGDGRPQARPDGDPVRHRGRSEAVTPSSHTGGAPGGCLGSSGEEFMAQAPRLDFDELRRAKEGRARRRRHRDHRPRVHVHVRPAVARRLREHEARGHARSRRACASSSRWASTSSSATPCKVSERQFPRIYGIAKPACDTLQIDDAAGLRRQQPRLQRGHAGDERRLVHHGPLVAGRSVHGRGAAHRHRARVRPHPQLARRVPHGAALPHVHGGHVPAVDPAAGARRAAHLVAQGRDHVRPRRDARGEGPGRRPSAPSPSSRSGSRKLYEEFNLDAFLEQHEEGSQGIGKYMEVFATHPWLPKRVLAMRVFGESQLFHKAIGPARRGADHERGRQPRRGAAQGRRVMSDTNGRRRGQRREHGRGPPAFDAFFEKRDEVVRSLRGLGDVASSLGTRSAARARRARAREQARARTASTWWSWASSTTARRHS